MARDRLLWPAVLAEDLLHATYEQAKSSAADLGSEKNEIASEANVDKYGGAAPKADFTLDQHGVAELRRRARTNGNKRGTNEEKMPGRIFELSAWPEILRGADK